MLYTVHNKCDEVADLNYDDGLQFLYFYTGGSRGGSTATKQLLNYLQKSIIDNVTDEATRTLHECVSKVKVSPEVRLEYMMWEEKVFYLKRDAKEEEHIRQILAKLEKGKSSAQIADELELTLEEVEKLIFLIRNKE